jgi:hypothetical protein
MPMLLHASLRMIGTWHASGAFISVFLAQREPGASECMQVTHSSIKQLQAVHDAL